MDDTIRARLEAAARGEAPSGPLTVAALVAAYVAWAKGYYTPRRDVEQWQNCRCGLAPLVELYGDRMADTIGAIEARAALLLMAERGQAATTIRARLCMIRHCWKWAIQRGMLSPTTIAPLMAVESVRRGVMHRGPVRPVSPESVESVLPHLPGMLAAMVRLQLAAAMRPGEVCAMRGEEIDTDGPVWRWLPAHHKTAHKGKRRVVWLGPRAVDLLAPWYRRSGWLFPTRFGTPYSAMSFGRAIRRVCESRGIAPWGPNRLRHSAATMIRETCGLEAAQALLGHARIETTQVYAEQSDRVAIDAAMRVG